MKVWSICASISVTITGIWTKFGTVDKYHTTNTPEWPNSHKLKIQDGGGRHLKFRKNVNNFGLDKDILHQWTDTSLVFCPTTGQAVCQDRLRETSLSLFCANCLELIAWDNNQHWLTVYLNLGLRRTSSVRLLINTHDWPATSTSEAKALGAL